MGNIRPTYIKRVAKDLLLEHSEKFNEDFDNNKNVVGTYTNIESKKIRNRVAGYATRYRKRKTE